MQDFIHKLRQKPESKRRQIALGTSAAVTGVIFAVWVTVLTQGGVIDSSTQVDNQQTASPVTALGNNATAAFSSFQERFSSSGSSSSSTAQPEENQADNMPSVNDVGANQNSPVSPKPYWESNSKQPSSTQKSNNANQTETSHTSPQGHHNEGADFWQDHSDSSDKPSSKDWF